MNIDRLLSLSEPWLQYGISHNLLGIKTYDMVELQKLALKDEKIKTYLRDVASFHATVVSTHKNPDLSIHKLLFLLELGFDQGIPEVKMAIDEILKYKDANGVYKSLVNIPKHFGGTGEDSFGWCLCDAPLLLLALIKAGVKYDEHIKQGVDYLASLFHNNGFPCIVSFEKGNFRGPGKKEDSCAYATLIMLKLFAEIPEYQTSELSKRLIQKLLYLWENSLTEHPYMFYMGTDFRKLKAPAFWYDIVSVLDVLSRFESARNEKAFLEMLAILRSKQNQEELFTPESIYLKCKAWDFGQKKVPSAYLTYVCHRIMERVG